MRNRVTISQEVFPCFFPRGLTFHKATAILILMLSLSLLILSLFINRITRVSYVSWLLLFNIMSGDSFMLLKVQFVFVAMFVV